MRERERLLLPLAAVDPAHVAHQCQLCVGEEGAYGHANFWT